MQLPFTFDFDVYVKSFFLVLSLQRACVIISIYLRKIESLFSLYMWHLSDFLYPLFIWIPREGTFYTINNHYESPSLTL